MSIDVARASVTLRELLQRAGPLLVEYQAPTEVLDREVTGLRILDPLDQLSDSPGTLLFGIGLVSTSSEAVRITREAITARAVGLIMHNHSPIPASLLELAGNRIALLEAPTDTDWDHLISTLRRGLDPLPGDEISGIPVGDLFGFANLLAAQMGGAVSVLDRQSTVLAYSTIPHQDLDEARRETIHDRRVPDRYTRTVADVLQKLNNSPEVIEVPADPDMRRRERLTVAVRIAGETIGSIWIANVGEPFSTDAKSILKEASQTAALHFIRHRYDRHHDATIRDDLVTQLLDGSDAADVMAIHLGIDPTNPVVVSAFESLSEGAPVSQLRRAITRYCKAYRRNAPVVDRGSRVYVLFPAPGGQISEVKRFVREVAAQAEDILNFPVAAGIGSVAGSVASAAGSRLDAERVLRVLHRDRSVGRIAALHDVLSKVALLELLDVIRERPHLQRGRTSILQTETNKHLAETLQTYLAQFGDVRAVAEILHVHPNTVRYRLQRVVQLTGLDLDDHADRLMADLQLLDVDPGLPKGRQQSATA